LVEKGFGVLETVGLDTSCGQLNRQIATFRIAKVQSSPTPNRAFDKKTRRSKCLGGGAYVL
jgi:hypothetical protein